MVPPGNPNEENQNSSPGPSPHPETSEPELGPIDVRELLESTRQLFTPDQLDESMQQAGYSPAPPIKPSPPIPPAGDNVVQVPSNASASENSLRQTESAEADTDSDGSGDSEVGPSTRGVNVLSIVAFVLAATLSPLAVFFGYIALGQTRRASQRGETLALWAIGIGWVVLAAWVVAVSALVWIGSERGVTPESLWELVELFRIP